MVAMYDTTKVLVNRGRVPSFPAVEAESERLPSVGHLSGSGGVSSLCRRGGLVPLVAISDRS